MKWISGLLCGLVLAVCAMSILQTDASDQPVSGVQQIVSSESDNAIPQPTAERSDHSIRMKSQNGNYQLEIRCNDNGAGIYVIDRSGRCAALCSDLREGPVVAVGNPAERSKSGQSGWPAALHVDGNQGHLQLIGNGDDRTLRSAR